MFFALSLKRNSTAAATSSRSDSVRRQPVICCDHFKTPCARKGFLTGRFSAHATFDASDFRSRIPRFSPDNLKANQAFVQLLDSIASRKGATRGSH
jgi:hypothetical protein